MRRPVRLLVLLLVPVTFVFAATSTAMASTPEPTAPVAGYDLERPPSECIGLLPRPDCGKVPEDAGERGGSLQYAVFALMLGGLAVIFTVVFRNVIRADKAKAAAAEAADASKKATASAARAEGDQVTTEG